MAIFPLALGEIFGHWGSYVIYLLIGVAFGAVLEMAGFGNSVKLARQFYFKEMTVLKVMFTAIIVAMVLVFGASAVGLLDFNLVYVNPTYLWPGIIGGLVMGFGFIIGGFCPGTSLVAAATAKIDGVFFVLGVFFGIFLFGETVGLYESFWYSSYLGRFTLPELFNVSTGWVVLAVVFMALFMFWGGEKLERIFGGEEYENAPVWRTYAAGGLVALAAVVLIIGQPTRADRWNRIAVDSEAAIAAREVQAHPGEVLEMMHDDRLNVMVLDVRSEADYNAFHLVDAIHAPPEAIDSMIPDLLNEPANTVLFLMSNDETQALEVWKTLKAEALPNVYVVEGGVNEWIATFADEEFTTANTAGRKGEDVLSYTFPVALGSRYGFADPNPDVFELEYESKVKLEQKRAAASGGCG